MQRPTRIMWGVHLFSQWLLCFSLPTFPSGTDKYNSTLREKISLITCSFIHQSSRGEIAKNSNNRQCVREPPRQIFWNVNLLSISVWLNSISIYLTVHSSTRPPLLFHSPPDYWNACSFSLFISLRHTTKIATCHSTGWREWRATPRWPRWCWSR